jgi:hypothetical protein
LTLKEQSNYLKLLDQTCLSLHLISDVTNFAFISFSLDTDNSIFSEGAIKLAEALKSNSSLTQLSLNSNIVASIHTHSNEGNSIGSAGATKLFEALKSNSSVTALNLGGKRPVASFHSHSMQVLV